jgi:hypothetical protein
MDDDRRLLRERKAVDGVREKSESDGLNVDAVPYRSSRKVHDDDFFTPLFIFFLLLDPPLVPLRRPRPQLCTLPTVPSEPPRVGGGGRGGGEDFSLTRLSSFDEFEG